MIFESEEALLKQFEKKKVLVVVPHEDDEINVAGQLIFQLCRNKSDCSVVYFTNGECFVDGCRRQSEAVAALKSLGLPKDKVHFLGFPDISSLPEDYSFAPKRQDAAKAVCDIIADKKPDYIITNDMDPHPNHIELATVVDDAVFMAIRKIDGYTPLLLKTYAYNMAFYSVDDYTGYNLKATLKPEEINNPFNRWEDRVRFPVPVRSMTEKLSNNIVFRALWHHHSQNVFKVAAKIANSDKAYWIRRTDSISYRAMCTASSGNVEFINDFRILDLDDKLNIRYDCCWIPDEGDSEKRIHMEFDKKSTVSRVVLFENKGDSCIISGKLILSNGFEKEITDIAHDGGATVIDIEPQKEIGWLEFVITEGTAGCGLSEIEVYEQGIGKPWFIKICVNDNYAYNYYGINDKDAIKVVGYDVWGNRADYSDEEVIIDKNTESKGIRISALLANESDMRDSVMVYGKSPSNIRKNDKTAVKLFTIADWFVNELYIVKGRFKNLTHYNK